MQSRTQILEGVISCVADSLVKPKEGMTASTKIIADLGADSLDFMDIIFQLDARFGVNLQKEDFDLLSRLEMERSEAIENDYLTAPAKSRLKSWLPDLPEQNALMPRDLARYISIESVVLIIEDYLRRQADKASSVDVTNPAV